jgi:hypothetical protein
MRIIYVILILLFFLPVSAHKPSDSFINLDIQDKQIKVRSDLALRDLDYLIGLDSNLDEKITWGEVKAKEHDIKSYIFSKLDINALCKRRGKTSFAINKHNDGNYASLDFTYDCRDKPEKLLLKYNILFAEDPDHRAFVNINYDGHSQAYILDSKHTEIATSLAKVNYIQIFFNFFDQGKYHIWSGIDHILFLLALLLPAVFSDVRKLIVVDKFKTALWSIVKIVTAFTVAHSITLSLAALELIQFNSKIIEASIALSVIIAAINNIKPLFAKKSWLVAFGFGLIHGFGFAGALQNLGLPLNGLLVALFSFNLGVEFGQLVIVITFIPLAYFLRKTWFYKNLVFKLGSIVILIKACIWLWERLQ